MKFSLVAGSGRNNHAYTVLDDDRHALAVVFKVGTANQDNDAGKGEFRIRLSMCGHPLLNKCVFANDFNHLVELLKEMINPAEKVNKLAFNPDSGGPECPECGRVYHDEVLYIGDVCPADDCPGNAVRGA